MRGAVGVVALVAALLGAGLAGVDPRPHSGSEYAERTTARLRALTARTDVLTEGEVRAGFGRARLTPTLGAAADHPERGEFVAVPLAGYGQRQGRPATGVHDDVWVKATAFAVGGKTSIVVAVDALIVPREVSEAAAGRIRAESGVDRAHVYFGSTHTHSSLGGWGEGLVAEAFAGGFRPGAREWMAGQLASAAIAAVKDLGPAAVGGGSFVAPEFVRNRLVGERGRIDPEFAVLLIRKTGGATGVIGSYAAHATVLSGSSMVFSADYPGFWQRSVEEKFGGQAMFIAGGVGSHAPRPPEGGLEGARRMGEALAERTVELLGTVTATNRLAMAFETLTVDLPPLQPRVSDGVRLRSWVSGRLLPVRADTALQAFRLGDRVWLSTPCDYSGEMALDLKEAARAAGLRAVVTSFNGDYVGYVVPSKYYHIDGYETRTMAFFGPQLPDYFDELLKGLVAAVASTGTASGRR